MSNSVHTSAQSPWLLSSFEGGASPSSHGANDSSLFSPQSPLINVVPFDIHEAGEHLIPQTVEDYTKLLHSASIRIFANGNEHCNNLWLKLQALFADPANVKVSASMFSNDQLDDIPRSLAQSISIRLNWQERSIAFLHNEDGAKQLLCKQRLNNVEYFIFSKLVSERGDDIDFVDIDLTRLVQNLTALASDGLIQEQIDGCEPGIEFCKIFGEEFLIFRGEDQRIFEILEVPDIEIANGFTGASKQVTSLGLKYESAVRLIRTLVAISRSATATRRWQMLQRSNPSSPLRRTVSLLASIQRKIASQVFEEAFFPVWQIGSDTWMSPMGLMIRYTNLMVVFKKILIGLEALHKADGNHGDIKPENMLLVPRCEFLDGDLDHALKYNVKILKDQIPDISDFVDNGANHDIILAINTIEGKSILYVKKLDNTIAEVDPGVNTYLAASLNNLQVLPVITKNDLFSLVLKHEKFLISKGLIPRGAWDAKLIDLWNMFCPLHRRYEDQAVDGIQGIATKAAKMDYLQNPTPQYITAGLWQLANKVETLADAIEVAKVRDNFAAALTLLEIVEGYTGHLQLADQGGMMLAQKCIPVGLPTSHSECYNEKQKNDDYKIPDDALDDAIASFNTNVDKVHDFCKKYVKAECETQFLALLSNPIHYLGKYVFNLVETGHEISADDLLSALRMIKNEERQLETTPPLSLLDMLKPDIW